MPGTISATIVSVIWNQFCKGILDHGCLDLFQFSDFLKEGGLEIISLKLKLLVQGTIIQVIEEVS